MSAGYSGTPLPKKLGIREGTRLTLLGPPSDFEKTLGTMPGGVTIRSRTVSEADVIVLFVTSFTKLKSVFAQAMKVMPEQGGMLWVAWPKKSSGVASDLDENIIRGHGLSLGVVDTKVCAIDETWSGLRFSRRRAK